MSDGVGRFPVMSALRPGRRYTAVVIATTAPGALVEVELIVEQCTAVIADHLHTRPTVEVFTSAARRSVYIVLEVVTTEDPGRVRRALTTSTHQLIADPTSYGLHEAVLGHPPSDGPTCR